MAQEKLMSKTSFKWHRVLSQAGEITLWRWHAHLHQERATHKQPPTSHTSKGFHIMYRYYLLILDHQQTSIGNHQSNINHQTI